MGQAHPRGAAPTRRRRGPPRWRWGGRTGRDAAGRGASSPAVLRTARTSVSSSSPKGGRMPRSARARRVFPDPGEPVKIRLWCPAAAISRARLAALCPLMSLRSGSGRAGDPPRPGGVPGSEGRSPGDPGGPEGWGRRGSPPGPRRPPGRSPGRNRGTPRSRARRAAGTAPSNPAETAVQGQLPQEEPLGAVPKGSHGGQHPHRHGHVQQGPLLGRIRRGQVHRHPPPQGAPPGPEAPPGPAPRASFTAASGSPTTVMEKSPPVISTSTSTGTASTPRRVTPRTPVPRSSRR